MAIFRRPRSPAGVPTSPPSPIIWGKQLIPAEDRRYHAVVTWATPWEIRKPRNTNRKFRMVALGDAYRVLTMIKTIRRCMILHWAADELVPLTHAYKLYANLVEPKEIRILDGANHRFTDPQHRRQTINYTANFFYHHLMKQNVH